MNIDKVIFLASIIHGCNAQGVMGAGVARQIRQTYPEAFQTYVFDLKDKRLYLGDVSIYWHNAGLAIHNAITQIEVGSNKRQVNYWAIAKVFEHAITFCKDFKMDLNFPKIGAGLTGGDWDIIEQIINDVDYKNRVKKICWVL